MSDSITVGSLLMTRQLSMMDMEFGLRHLRM